MQLSLLGYERLRIAQFVTSFKEIWFQILHLIHLFLLNVVGTYMHICYTIMLSDSLLSAEILCNN